MTQEKTRTEHDTMGPVEVPANRLWGAQTERSRRNFRISGERMPVELVAALVLVKKAVARVNVGLGELDADRARAVESAADEVLAGGHGDEFPLVVWQTGSGTQTNMNVNEVLANRASEILGGPRGEGRLVHPNDHVNRGQSSNDVFPTAMHVAAATAIRQRVLPALDALADALEGKAREYSGVVKIGRTHLMDATPLTLGQEVSGWAAQLRHGIAALESSFPSLCELALGGTAVGTGLNAHPELAGRAAGMLRELTDIPFTSAVNKFAALAGCDALVQAHGALRGLAASLTKIANDVRWLGSGPRSGLGELVLPANEPGSSIMPGKVNPTQCEAMTMACARVIGNDVAVTLGAASGNFELNVYRPMIIDALLQSCRLIADASDSFRANLVDGLQADLQRIREHLERSLMLVTALNPHIGYDKAAEIAKKAHAEGTTLRAAAIELGHVTSEQFDAWVRPEAMTGPS